MSVTAAACSTTGSPPSATSLPTAGAPPAAGSTTVVADAAALADWTASSGDVAWGVHPGDGVELVVAAPAAVDAGSRFSVTAWLTNWSTEAVEIAPQSCDAPFVGHFGPSWAYDPERFDSSWSGDPAELPDRYAETYLLSPVRWSSPVRAVGEFDAGCPGTGRPIGVEPGATVRYDGYVDAAMPPGRLPDEGRFAVDLVATIGDRDASVRAFVMIVDDPRRADSAEPELSFLMDDPTLQQFVDMHAGATFGFDISWWDGWWRFRARADDRPDLEFVSSRDGDGTNDLVAAVFDAPSWRRGDPPLVASVDLADRPDAPTPEIGDPIVDGQWVLASVDDVPVASADLPSIEFARGGVGGRVGGFDGCGAFDVTGTFDGRVLTAESAEVQAPECPDVDLFVIPSSGIVELDGDELVITENGGRTLRYRDLRRLPLGGPDDVAGAWVAGSGPSSIVTFEPGGSVTLGECDLTWSIGRGRLVVEGWPPTDETVCLRSIIGRIADPLISFAGNDPVPNPARVLVDRDGSLLVSDGPAHARAVHLVPAG